MSAFQPGLGSPSLPGSSFVLEKLGHATRHATKLELVGFLAKKVKITAACLSGGLPFTLGFLRHVLVKVGC